ncbi:glycosyl hydrolase family 18 protein [Legionella dresdenensis]|uniref:Glycosyl hydrolase family 18 protein n=1 Tax=Legionella dresdenensis TaxID=450200 RepID=A0ABV8CBH4_9GAMM
MKKLSLLLGTSLFFATASVSAAAIMDVIPSSSNPIAISSNSQTYLTYSVKNNTRQTLSALSIDPAYGNANNILVPFLSSNYCTAIAPGASCNFIVAIQAPAQNAAITLTPRVCAYNGTACSIPVSANRVSVIASSNVPGSTFPTPYAGTFYPIYFAGVGQWIEPDINMPFERVSAIFIAFAHTYPAGLGAIFTYEAGQPDQPGRIARLLHVARSVNPGIKLLISLGWDKNDWTYINNDYVNHANLFVPSVIQFIRDNHLDGLDIDDEGIGGSTGFISQENFDGVIANLRNALNYAALQDGKPYYLTISPAGNNSVFGGLQDTQVDRQNANSFDLINIQTYYNGDPDFGENFFDSLIMIGYPATRIANGIDTENCTPVIPPYAGTAGLFNWNMSADSACSNFQYTIQIADLVGYNG